METKKLADFLENNTQTEAAKIIGCTQGNISQMIESKRAVFIEIHADGTKTHYEIKRPKSA